MSILSGAHDYLFPKVMELLREKGISDILVIGEELFQTKIFPCSSPAEFLKSSVLELIRGILLNSSKSREEARASAQGFFYRKSHLSWGRVGSSPDGHSSPPVREGPPFWGGPLFRPGILAFSREEMPMTRPSGSLTRLRTGVSRELGLGSWGAETTRSGRYHYLRILIIRTLP